MRLEMSKSALNEIEVLKQSAEINIFKTDIANPDDVKKLFNNMKDLLPLKGIIHSAMVFNDIRARYFVLANILN